MLGQLALCMSSYSENLLGTFLWYQVLMSAFYEAKIKKTLVKKYAAY